MWNDMTILEKISGGFLKILNLESPCSPEILSQLLIQEEWVYMSIPYLMGRCSSSFICHGQSLGTACYPSRGEWTDNWGIHTPEACSAVGRNELLLLAMTWVSLKAITLSVRSLTQWEVLWFHLTSSRLSRMDCDGKINRWRKTMAASVGWRQGVSRKGPEGTLWSGGNIKLFRDSGFTGIWICQEAERVH